LHLSLRSLGWLRAVEEEERAPDKTVWGPSSDDLPRALVRQAARTETEGERDQGDAQPESRRMEQLEGAVAWTLNAGDVQTVSFPVWPGGGTGRSADLHRRDNAQQTQARGQPDRGGTS
jgi:hypothetical protein